MTEDEILLSKTEDLIRECSNDYLPAFSNFLDPIEQSKVVAYLNNKHVHNYVFYGGFPDSLRNILIFYPDYVDKENIFTCLENPLSALKINCGSLNEIGHRDILGSLMSLGIKREVVGDIIVNEKDSYILTLKRINDFILNNLKKIRRQNVNITVLDSPESLEISETFEELKDSVASLRLDNVIAAVFNLSRTKAQDMISGKLVYVNNLLIEKNDYLINENDKLVLRGKGKVIFNGIEGKSKKGRLIISYKKFK